MHCNTLALFILVASLQSPTTNVLGQDMWQINSLNDSKGFADINRIFELMGNSSLEDILRRPWPVRLSWTDSLLSRVKVDSLFRTQNQTYKAGDVRYLNVRPNLKCLPSTEVPCVLFSECIQNVSLCFTSNTTIHFLPGNYTISGNTPVIVQDVANLTLVGPSSQHPSATLHCNGNMSFVFADVANLSISGLRITNCGMEMPEFLTSLHYTRWNVNGTKAALFLINIHTLQLTNVHIEKSCGYGLLGFNIVGSSTITSCRFSYNNRRKPNQKEAESSDTMDACTTKGGNALLMFQCPYPFKNGEYHITLKVSSSEFSHGIDTSKWYLYYDQAFTPRLYQLFNPNEVGGGSGLGIIIHEPGLCYADGNLSMSIVNCNFHHNTAQVGANTLVRYHRDSDVYAILSRLAFTRYAVHIFNCTFHQGRAYVRGGGMSVETNDLSLIYTKVPSVNISHSKFVNNSADYGGGLYFLSRTGVSCYRSVDVPHFSVESCGFHDNAGVEGGGMHVLLQKNSGRGTFTYTVPFWKKFRINFPDCYSGMGIFTVVISNSTFLKNIATRKGGSVHMLLNMMTGVITTIPSNVIVPVGKAVVVNVNTCSFEESQAKDGCAVSIDGCGTHGGVTTTRRRSTLFLFTSTITESCTVIHDTTIMFTNAVFSKNGVTDKVPVQYGTAALQLQNIEEISLNQCTFENNNGSGLYTDSAEIYLQGVITFTNNTGYTGGAFILDCYPYTQQSVIHLTSNTTLYLTNNTALYSGGAIAAQEGCSDSNPCFFQLNFSIASSCPHCSNTEESMDYYNTRIITEGNTAKDSGDSIYVWRQTAPEEICRVDSTQSLTPSIFRSLFEIPGNSSSEVVSPAYKVCFCFNPLPVYGSEVYECDTSASIDAYRGQTFHVPTVGIGQYDYPSRSVIRTILQENLESERQYDSSGELGERQAVQELSDTCDSLTYTVRSFENSVTLRLSVESSIAAETLPAFIEVSLRPCPFGFEQTGHPPTCDCAAHLREAGITCDIDTQTILRPAGMWIGNNSGYVVVHTNCPLDYCKPEEVEISLHAQDEQCAFNRSGVLCGACQPGLSLALGTSKCLQCSNFYLFLILAYAVAGMALVLLLLKCNLTVSDGTINGLIFYANIVWLNRSVYFPPNSGNFFTAFLSVFLAWVNLDLGIETCFADGLNASTKVWLQFLFPAYVLTVMGFVLYRSQYSPTVYKLVGSNAVPVLATLFLLSYTKLLRTVIAAVTPITMTDRNGSASTVWLLDGNVPYSNGSHIALLVAALLVILAGVIPYTLLVLLAPIWSTWNTHRYRMLLWVDKLKSLTDTYQQPYRKGFKHWTGLMLLVRFILSVVFAATMSNPAVNLLVVSAVLLALVIVFWRFGAIYKNTATHAVECFYIVNLGFYTIVTQFLSTPHVSPQSWQEYLTWIMVGSGFIVFCGVLLFHFHQQLNREKVLQWLLMHFHRIRKDPLLVNQSDDEDTEEAEHEELLRQHQPTVHVIELSDLNTPTPSEERSALTPTLSEERSALTPTPSEEQSALTPTPPEEQSQLESAS